MASKYREKEYNYIYCREQYYPYIPITIHGKKKGIFYALVDSGASMSLFHSSIAEDLGIALEDSEKVILIGVCGVLESIQAYLKDKVQVSLEGLGTFSMPVAFTDHEFQDTLIIGREGFFENFEITFREWEKKLSLTPRRNLI